MVGIIFPFSFLFLSFGNVISCKLSCWIHGLDRNTDILDKNTDMGVGKISRISTELVLTVKLF